MTPGAPFRAQYESKGLCPAGCGFRLHVGDTIRYDENDELVHDSCRPRPDPTELGPNEILCGVCWITPCRC